jgi:D-methionine transport system permease protein
MNHANIDLALHLVPIELWNTLYMVFVSAFFSILIGLPLGIILTLTDKGHLKENRIVHEVLGTIVNIGRSFPFAILMIAIIPITRFIVGTSLGTTASIVPLTLAAIPFFARIAEAAFKEIDKSLVEAAVVMGAAPCQIVRKILLPEALPSLIIGATTTFINLIGYSTMAGTMGGGGLGKIAIQYGYQRFNTFLIVVTVILLIILVQAVQWIGNQAAKSINHKRGRSFSHD